MADGHIVDRGFVAINLDIGPAMRDLERLIIGINRTKPNMQVELRPDSDGLRTKVRAQIKAIEETLPDIKAEVDVAADKADMAKVRAQLQKIDDGVKAEIDVGLDGSDLIRARKQLEAAFTGVSADLNKLDRDKAREELDAKRSIAAKERARAEAEVLKVKLAEYALDRAAHAQATRAHRDSLAQSAREHRDSLARAAATKQIQDALEDALAANEPTVRLRTEYKEAVKDAGVGMSLIRALLRTRKLNYQTKLDGIEAAEVYRTVAEAQIAAGKSDIEMKTVLEDIKQMDLRRAKAMTQARLKRLPLYLTLAIRDMSPRGLTRSLAGLKSRLKAFSLVANLTADTAQFFRKLTGALRLGRTMAEKAKISVNIGMFGFKAGMITIAGFAAALAGALPYVATFVQGVAAIGPAFAVLPAVIAGAGAAIFVLKKAFDGFGDALQAAASGDMEALNKALSELPPQANAAARSMISLRGSLDGDKAIQNTFWYGLAEPIARLKDTLIPSLRAQFVGLSAELNRHAAIFLEWLNSSSAVEQINRVLGFTRQAFANLSPAVRPFLDMMGNISAVGAGFLPQLAAGLTSVVQAASGAIAALTQSGQLSGMISAGFVALSQLGSILVDTFSILWNIIEGIGAGGGGTLGAMAETMERLAAVAATPEFKDQIAAVFSNLNVAFQAIAGAIPYIIEAIAALSPVLGMLGQVVGFAIGGIAQAFTALSPAIIQVANIIGGSLMAAFAAIEPMLPALTEAIGTALVQAVEALAPMLPLIATAIIEIIQAILPLVPVLAQMVAKLLPPIIGIVTAIVPILADLFATILPPLIDVVVALLDAVMPLLPVLGDLLKTLLAPIVKILGAIVPVIKALVDAIIPIVKQWVPYLEAGLNIIIGVLELLVPVINVVIDILGKLFTEYARLWKEVVQGLEKFLKWIGEMLVDGLLRGIAEGWIKMTNFFNELAGNFIQGVKDIFGIRSPSRVMRAIGAFITMGLAQGIMSLSSQVYSATSSLADMAVSGFGSPELAKKLSLNVGAEIGSSIERAALGVGALSGRAALVPGANYGGNRTNTFNQNVTVMNPRAEASGYTINQATRMAAAPGNPAARVFPRR